MVEGFEWDPLKAQKNIDKHGITFEEAATVFYDANALTIPDPQHSNGEIREIALGTTVYGQCLVVSFTYRHSAIRIISSRRANKRERRQYEEGTEGKS